MSEVQNIDIREEENIVIGDITFADEWSNTGTEHAFQIGRYPYAPGIVIKDSTYDLDNGIGYVVLESALDADNLIKAIEKAKSLGWLV